jgi:hypothetical protein
MNELSEEKWMQLYELLYDGHSVREIARQLKISKVTVGRYRRFAQETLAEGEILPKIIGGYWAHRKHFSGDKVNGKIFTCIKYHVDMPLETSDAFCARRFHSCQAGDYCLECEKGIAAAKIYPPTVMFNKTKPRKSVPIIEPEVQTDQDDESLIEKITEESEGKQMPDKMKCKNGCGKGAVKDGICTRCYRKLHGVLPYPKKASGDTKFPAAAVLMPDQVTPKGASRSKESPIQLLKSLLPVTVDFGSYPDTHTKLIDLARDEHRTPELQLLHIIVKHFDVKDLTNSKKVGKKS